ncbi:uncharacterized protein K02A2.6-like [Pistacia vera]|uniref:uncharacterized protein K02A2.6-like n=1 Tax=Pistacia vera TaxID=55513 RepID=UPI0012633223|nr:uncharacterized protein K02A2.6-like [Pistacia vera]
MSEIYRCSMSSTPRIDNFDKSWPFAIWGIDLIGHLPQGKGGVKFIVVAVDYFTKWIEFKPLATITSNKLKDFIYKNIICRFEMPYTIITDNGKQFDYKDFQSFYERLRIKKRFATVYWPQANGQVEAVNKVIKHTIKKKLDALEGR